MPWSPLVADKSPARPKKYCMVDPRMLPLPPCLLPFGPPIFSRSYSGADDADAVGPLAELALPFSGPIRDRAAAVGRWGCSSGLLMCLACGVLVGLTGSAPCGSCRGWTCVLFFLFPQQYPIGQMPAPRGFGDATMPATRLVFLSGAVSNDRVLASTPEPDTVVYSAWFSVEGNTRFP